MLNTNSPKSAALSDAELIEKLLTADGVGREAKRQALALLISRVAHMDRATIWELLAA